MADPPRTPPLTRASVIEAHELIKPYIHLTPVVTSTTLSNLASSPRTTTNECIAQDSAPARPKIRLFFKCENQQRVGAFKARGAFHALARLSPEERRRGVITHSSGNHAQAVALAARTHNVKAYIVMPTISVPSKIAATKGYGAEVIFSGSTSEEREAVAQEVIKRTNATLVPPYDHPNIILGQGTMALEFERQVEDLLDVDEREQRLARSAAEDGGNLSGTTNGVGIDGQRTRKGLDAIIAPCGGGGMLSGIATAMTGTGIQVFGAEPSFEGADDARRGLAQGQRIPTVQSLTIADGLRTPVGIIPWSIIHDGAKVRAIYAVSEAQITAALTLVIERMKVFIEPSAAVGLAAVLYNDDFRRLVEREAGPEGWNIGVILSGGNTTLEALAEILSAGRGGRTSFV